MQDTQKKHKMVLAAFQAKPYKLKKDKGNYAFMSQGKASPFWRELTPSSNMNNISCSSPKHIILAKSQKPLLGSMSINTVSDDNLLSQSIISKIHTRKGSCTKSAMNASPKSQIS